MTRRGHGTSSQARPQMATVSGNDNVLVMVQASPAFGAGSSPGMFGATQPVSLLAPAYYLIALTICI